VKRAIVLAISVILALIVVASVSFAQSTSQANAKQNPGVVPPGTGKYASLSAQWWQWAYSIPASDNPLSVASTTDGATCATGQSGKVWFLGGLFTPPGQPFPEGGQIERTCNVPAGKSIFLPIFNAERSTVEGNPLLSILMEVLSLQKILVWIR
jgi:hypothetical protein